MCSILPFMDINMCFLWIYTYVYNAQEKSYKDSQETGKSSQPSTRQAVGRLKRLTARMEAQVNTLHLLAQL